MAPHVGILTKCKTEARGNKRNKKDRLERNKLCVMRGYICKKQIGNNKCFGMKTATKRLAVINPTTFTQNIPLIYYL